MKKVLGGAALCMLSLTIIACGYTPRVNHNTAISEAAEKKDILIFNSAKLSSKKIDGKIVKLKDKEERKRFLDLLSVVKEYQPGKVYEHLSKSKKTGDYTERACLAVCLVNKKNPDKKVDVLLADKKIDLDYRLSDRKISRLCGVKVELSKVEELNCDDKILTRAVFHIGKKHCVLEGTNIEPSDFVEMTGAVIMRMNDK